MIKSLIHFKEKYIIKFIFEYHNINNEFLTTFLVTLINHNNSF